jgi:SAM-dependent methyltransferase
MTDNFRPKKAHQVSPQLINRLNGWTNGVAKHCVSKVLPLAEGSVIHDNGCSSAMPVANAILSLEQKPTDLTIHATDVSPLHVGGVEKQAAARGLSNVKASVHDAMKLGFEDGTFTHSFTNFVVHGLPPPGPSKALAEIYRTLRPDGIAVVGTWYEVFNWEPVQQAHLATRPGAQRMMPWFETWLKPETLVNELASAGFSKEIITSEQVSILVVMEGQDALKTYAESWWSMFAGTLGWKESDDENWDRAIDIVVREMEKDKDVVWKAEENAWHLTQSATVAVAKK